MQIFGKMPDGRCITIEVDMNAGVFDVACKFTDKGALRPCHQRLIFAGKQLEHDRTLRDYDIQKESTIHLLYRCVRRLCICYGKYGGFMLGFNDGPLSTYAESLAEASGIAASHQRLFECGDDGPADVASKETGRE